VEQHPNSQRTTRVRATFSGDQLTVSTTGDRATDYTITFDPIDNGSRLRVTRQLYIERLGQPVVVRSVYERVSDVAQWDIYTGRPRGQGRGTAAGEYFVRDGDLLVTRLNDSLNTNRARSGDRFTLTVISPSQYEGAVIEGYVSNVDRGGRLTGRSEMAMSLESIRLRNGQTYRFDGTIESVRAADGETVPVDNEGAVREDDSQTRRTVTRTGIGAALGAILGAVIEGGEGAAIGAAIGAGTGAGSVYVQGRNDLELTSGTEITIRAGAPTARVVR
jgi:outer membrane lipoprotein SlyB